MQSAQLPPLRGEPWQVPAAESRGWDAGHVPNDIWELSAPTAVPAAMREVALGEAETPSGWAFAIPDGSLEAAVRTLRESAHALEERRRDAVRDARFRWASLVSLSQLQLHVRAVYRAVGDLGRVFAAYPPDL